MCPALVVALGSYHVSPQACIAGLDCIRVCFSRERSAVPAVAHICVFNLAEVSASSARAYFLGWDGSLVAVMVSLVKNCHEIEEYVASGLALGRCGLWVAVGMVRTALQCGASRVERGRIRKATKMR
jgi:hypothetical protein